MVFPEHAEVEEICFPLRENASERMRAREREREREKKRVGVSHMYIHM